MVVAAGQRVGTREWKGGGTGTGDVVVGAEQRQVGGWGDVVVGVGQREHWELRE